MYTASGQSNRDALLRQHQPLVRQIAQRLIFRLPSNVELDDLIQVGMMGLLEAIARFDASQGHQFTTFASQRIQGAMIDDLRGNDVMSRTLRKHQKDISAAKSKLEHELGRAPRDSEIAQRLGLKLQEYQQIAGDVFEANELHIEDLSNSEEEDQSNFLDRFMVDSDINPSELLSKERKRKALIVAIEKLQERDQQIMSMYYEQDMNLKEIAATFSLTESRVSQIMSRIVSDLRKAMVLH